PQWLRVVRMGDLPARRARWLAAAQPAGIPAALGLPGITAGPGSHLAGGIVYATAVRVSRRAGAVRAARRVECAAAGRSGLGRLGLAAPESLVPFHHLSALPFPVY